MVPKRPSETHNRNARPGSDTDGRCLPNETQKRVARFAAASFFEMTKSRKAISGEFASI
uniref:Uncharacterized protein n=1 Tax=Anguilla anguilla TaxID=7936 RepID=A0A0E9RH59_ANGAN